MQITVTLVALCGNFYHLLFYINGLHLKYIPPKKIYSKANILFYLCGLLEYLCRGRNFSFSPLQRNLVYNIALMDIFAQAPGCRIPP